MPSKDPGWLKYSDNEDNCALACGPFIVSITSDDGIQVSDDRGLLWSDKFKSDPLSDYTYPVVRRIRTFPWQSMFWANQEADVAVGIFEDGDELRVAAWRLHYGQRLWMRRLPVPPPAWFTEKNPPKGNAAEELHAFLATDPHALAVCIQRTSRCQASWGGDDDDNEEDFEKAMTIPEFAARLEIVRLDPQTGQTIWENAYDHAHVGICDRERFDGLFALNGRFNTIDWTNGSVREILACPGAFTGRPIRREDDVVCAYYQRGRFFVAAVPFSGGPPRTANSIEFKMARRNIDVYLTDHGGVINISSQTYIVLSHDFKPTGIIKLRGWYRGIVSSCQGTIDLLTTIERTRIQPSTATIIESERF